MVGGTVTAYRSTGTPGGDENFVIVQGADGMYTIYAHVTPSVTSGTVVAGQTIGTVDNTGTTSNPHVHICRSSTQSCSGGVEYKPADCP
jgi:murein DD-endopeptidase MepM/ murein hydrolase activator NlpD